MPSGAAAEAERQAEVLAYLGRVVVALTPDPQVIGRTGQLLEVGALAHEYGFTDTNGTQPPPVPHAAAPVTARATAASVAPV